MGLIEETITALLGERDDGKTICPSEAARALKGKGDWRSKMPDVREAAYDMADRGEIVITQGGEVVDGRAVRGPIRLRLPG